MIERQLIVPAGAALRLDQFLISQRAESSRRRARELIATGAVRINGRRARKGQLVQPGDVVTIMAEPLLPDELAAEPFLNLPILFADAAVVAVDKPGGMPSAARLGNNHGTVANFLVGRFPELRRVGTNPLEAGLVHRLDNGTSGVLLAARTAAAYASLRRQFHDGLVDKHYLALVAGTVDRPGVVTHPIAHEPRRPRRMRVCPDPTTAAGLGARRAETKFRPLRRAPGATLLALRIRTGVRHQVRVHLAAIGHPVIGDPLYGRRGLGITAPRLLLHASRIRVAHPSDQSPLELQATIPEDFRGAIERLAWWEDAPPGWESL